MLDGHRGPKGSTYIQMKFCYDLFEIRFEADPKFALRPVSDDFYAQEPGGFAQVPDFEPLYEFRTEVVYTKFVDDSINVDDIVNKKKDDKPVVYYDIGFIKNGLKA